MGLFNKILGRDDRESEITRHMKELDRKGERTLAIAEATAKLEECKAFFERVIRTERLNALERRDRRIGDATQKARIHDAAVGLLAVEEAQLEMRSVTNAEEFGRCMKMLQSVLGQMTRMDPGASINKKDLKEQTGAFYDDTNATQTFTDRAALVDEQFVEYLIQGYSMEECMDKKYPHQSTLSLDGLGDMGTTPGSFTPPAPAPASDDEMEVDFSGDKAQDDAYLKSVLERAANRR